MRKAALVLLLLVLLGGAAWARDLTGTGSGATVEDANACALADLAGSVKVRVKYTAEQEQKDDGALSSTSFSQSFKKSTLVESDVVLQGVVYKEPRRLQDGTWEVEARIPETHLDIYRKMKGELLGALSSADLDRTGPWEELGPYYDSLLKARAEWDVCATVLTILSDGKEPIDDGQIPTWSDLNAALDRAMTLCGTSVEMVIKGLEIKGRRKAITKEEEDLLKEKKAERDRIAEEREERRREREEALAALATRKESEVIQHLEGLKTYMESRGGTFAETEATDLVALVEYHRETYNEVKENLSKHLEGLRAEFLKEAGQQADEIYRRPYGNVELDGEGFPDTRALEARVSEVDKRVFEIYDAYYQSALELYSAAFKELEAISKEASDLIASLPGKSIVVSSSEGNVSTKIGSFDLASGVWDGSASFYLENHELKVGFSIPYAAWTGGRVPLGEEVEAYKDYIAESDFWNTLFLAYPNAYDVQIVYHLAGTMESNEYILFVDEVRALNPLEEGKKVWSVSNPSKFLLRIGANSRNMTSPHVPNPFNINSPQKDPAAALEKKLAEKAIKAMEAKPSAPVPEPSKGTSGLLKKKPKPPAPAQTRIKRPDGSTFLLGLDLAIRGEEGGTRASVLSLGLRKMGSKPVFADTRAVFDLDLGVLSSDSLLRKAGLKGRLGIGLGLASFVDSLTHFDWGVSLALEVDPANLSWSSLIPAVRLGCGADARSINRRFWLEAGAAFPLDSSPARLVVAAGFALGWYAR